VLFDPRAERTLSADVLHSAIDHSTYEGTSVRGWPVVTISRGEVLVAGGELRAQPGRGRFVRRSYAAGPLPFS
jgi:dihydropyrimidinase